MGQEIESAYCWGTESILNYNLSLRDAPCRVTINETMATTIYRLRGQNGIKVEEFLQDETARYAPHDSEPQVRIVDTSLVEIEQ